MKATKQSLQDLNLALRTHGKNLSTVAAMEMLAVESGGIQDLASQFNERHLHREQQQQHQKIKTKKGTRQGGVHLRKTPDIHT